MSYERVFIPDVKRGYWAKPSDFIYAGIGLAFRMDMFSLPWFYLFDSRVISFLIIYFTGLYIYIIPFIVMQSFLGQFSSSGFISALRITPLFKGLGYITLALNICVLICYCSYAVIPLVYMFASMQPVLPWSCEGYKKWLIDETITTLCNIPEKNETFYPKPDIHFDLHIPSVLYFKSLFNNVNLVSKRDVEFSMSWQLSACAILVWTMVAFVFYKFFNTKRFGQIIRYTVWTLLGLLLILLIRFSFLPGSDNVFKRDFIPTLDDFLDSIILIPVYGISAFGPGWGLFITLSSFNKFKTNIMKQSWLIAFGQLGVVVGLNMLPQFIQQYYREETIYNYPSDVEYVWFIYLTAGSAIDHMAWSNLWSILLYLMLFLSGMLLIIMQLYTILASIFDEFANLREHKVKICMGLIAAMAIFSLYFTSNHGLIHIDTLLTDVYVSQTVINLLLILIVLWLYGRERFQRDIEFMINKRFSTWKIYILRFLLLLGILQVLMSGVALANYLHYTSPPTMTVLAFIFILIPWSSIPIYAIYFMCQKTKGSCKARLQHSCKPHDWYPVEQEDRQRYEDELANINVNHQLNEINDNNISSI